MWVCEGPALLWHRLGRHNLYSRAPLLGARRAWDFTGNHSILSKDTGPLGSSSASPCLASSSFLSHIFRFHRGFSWEHFLNESPALEPSSQDLLQRPSHRMPLNLLTTSLGHVFAQHPHFLRAAHTPSKSEDKLSFPTSLPLPVRTTG